MFKNVYIPYGSYYSTPFCKWQGSLQNENSIVLGAKTSRRFFDLKQIDTTLIDYLYFGQTVLQKGSFYAPTYAAHLMGLPDLTGQAVTQACATSTTAIFDAALAVEAGYLDAAYCLFTDRLSNAPHIVWPNPAGPGGEVLSENINLDNMGYDPSTGYGMLTTGENVAKEHGFTKEEADEMTWMRYEQYQMALADDRAFQKRYMLPIELASRKKTVVIEMDEGIAASSKEGLAKLKPVQKDGILTFGSQTHPADGNVGLFVTNQEKAKALSKEAVTVQVVGYGYNRTKAATMPAAPSGAVQMALKNAGVALKDVKTFKNHTPFIVNDLHLCKTLGLKWDAVNNYGTSVVFGHPQGPTLARLAIEAIEETVLKGGGYAVVAGCHAGDSAAALVLKID
ncbi:thiolase family protein [Fusibacter paucivorans]|uniref:acetyl-CoA C-acetyltransferase n=1 Tax=Fusibacter paucivorans TaxID=76009 RepID=A0ABS5PPA6_9FIRM|nr:thiolase family protein [Fusibacter paucivorans]MBS7526732.1 thiolase family protein [Fusibacter paucivorans]